MLPQPALYLWSLDLNYNKIDYLPKDMFEDMPYLKELKLDYNRLVTIKGGVYKIVWNQLTQLWLDGNDMVCWALCPVLSENKREKKDRPLFFDSSICEKPPKKMVLLESFEC
ncbi:leucine-rich repeat transmembrane neuronal protein 1 isoform X2 [Parasteatoda tepidariorum]|uniref:leucine-rich repeat transmembrane neuronal protein 1 isoform X2 n=1 Tax=Parasteatoda tepidariorum TaxID=114398 RepID=UPI0039BCC495